MQAGNIVGTIANVGGIEGSDSNGLDIHPDCSFVRLPEAIAPEKLGRLAQMRVRGQLLAITLAEQAPAGKRRKYRR